MRMVRAWVAWLPVLAGVAFALWLYGRAVDPGWAGWLLHGDPAQHYLGSVFFRAEPWHWPPGLIARFGDSPTSLVFTDAIPAVALAAKLLRLDAAQQYFGLWMVLCHAMAGWCGFRLLRTLGAPELRAAWGAMFFIAAPPLLLRAYGHEALMAQFLVLAAIERALAVWRWWPWLVLAGVAVLVHPYLALMVGVLGSASGIAALLEKQLTLLQLAVRAAVSLAMLYALAWLAGFFVGSGEVSAAGHGFFSANLLTWLDPMSWAQFHRDHGLGPEGAGEWSKLLPPLWQATIGQYEGFAYLGAGMLVLVAVWLAVYWRGAGQVPLSVSGHRWHCTLGACIVLALLAVSAWPSLGPYMPLRPPLDGHLGRALGVFRASGRFIWPLTYLLMAVVLVRVSALRWGVALLAAALLLQAADLRDKFREFRHRFRAGPPGVEAPVTSSHWSRMFHRCPRLELVSAQPQGAAWKAPALAAAEAGASLHPAPTARLSNDALAVQQEAVRRLTASQGWRQDTIYLLAQPLPDGRTIEEIAAGLSSGRHAARHHRLEGRDLVVPAACDPKA